MPTTHVVAALRSGICPNERTFDGFLAEELRAPSSMFWTPLPVIVCAVRWLEQAGVQHVLDIGSGAGKFCVAGALASRLQFTGLEHRPRLVRAARNLAARFDVSERVRFVEGTVADEQLPAADAYYLFNPFAENLFGLEDRLDEEVEAGVDCFERDVASMLRGLQRAPAGTVLVTYNGFGAEIPREYRLICQNRDLPNDLVMWRKETPAGHGENPLHDSR